MRSRMGNAERAIGHGTIHLGSVRGVDGETTYRIDAEWTVTHTVVRGTSASWRRAGLETGFRGLAPETRVLTRHPKIYTSTYLR